MLLANARAIICDFMNHMNFDVFLKYMNFVHRFFNETWSLSIYHDRFADFREELRELLTSRPVRV